MYHFIMRFPKWDDQESFHIWLDSADFFLAKDEFLSYCNIHNIKWISGPILVDCFYEYGFFCP